LEYCPSECEVSKQNDKISGSAGFFPVEFEALPKIHSACDIEKADLFA
jgi:hypothetical protein